MPTLPQISITTKFANLTTKLGILLPQLVNLATQLLYQKSQRLKPCIRRIPFQCQIAHHAEKYSFQKCKLAYMTTIPVKLNLNFGVLGSLSKMSTTKLKVPTATAFS